jgi:predicted RNase H-like nuclease (RuvC/YqgF family)
MSKQKIKSETLSRKTEAATLTTTMNKELEKKPNNISILENEIAELEYEIEMDKKNIAKMEERLDRSLLRLQKRLQLELTGGAKAETKI